MALTLPAPAWGGPSTSGKRRAWTPPSCGVPHSGRCGDRNRIPPMVDRSKQEGLGARDAAV